MTDKPKAHHQFMTEFPAIAAAYAAMIAEAQNARRIVIQPFLSTNGV